MTTSFNVMPQFFAYDVVDCHGTDAVDSSQFVLRYVPSGIPKTDLADLIGGHPRCAVVFALGVPALDAAIGHVDVMCARKQMGWTNASDTTTIAVMEDPRGVCWQFPIGQDVGHNMGATVSPSETEHSVAVLSFCCGPDPAGSRVREMGRCRPIFIDTGPEPLTICCRFSLRKSTTAIAAVRIARPGYGSRAASAWFGRLSSHRQLTPGVARPRPAQTDAGLSCVNYTTHDRCTLAFRVAPAASEAA